MVVLASAARCHEQRLSSGGIIRSTCTHVTRSLLAELMMGLLGTTPPPSLAIHRYSRMYLLSAGCIHTSCIVLKYAPTSTCQSFSWLHTDRHDESARHRVLHTWCLTRCNIWHVQTVLLSLPRSQQHCFWGHWIEDRALLANGRLGSAWQT